MGRKRNDHDDLPKRKMDPLLVAILQRRSQTRRRDMAFWAMIVCFALALVIHVESYVSNHFVNVKFYHDMLTSFNIITANVKFYHDYYDILP